MHYNTKNFGSGNASVFCRNVCGLFGSGQAACRRDCAACCHKKKRAAAAKVKGAKSCGCGR